LLAELYGDSLVAHVSSVVTESSVAQGDTFCSTAV
jgi:hypothetical protein